MSMQAFNDFIRAATTADSNPARQSSLASALGNFDKSLTGEAKGMAVIKNLASTAKSEGYDVTEDDVIQYMQNLKVQYETNPVVASMMDSYCSSTCHLGSVTGNQ